MRYPVSAARVQGDEAGDDPADPLDHLLSPRPGRPLRMGRPQRGQERAAAAPRKREPDPPTPEQAARLLNLVRAEDEEFGLYLWASFTTGACRGEVTALRENRFDFARQQIRVCANYIVKQGSRIEKAPKA